MKTAFQKFFECVKFAQIKKLIAKHEFHHFPISRTTMIFSVIVHRNLPFNRTIYIFNIPEKTGKLPNFSSLTNHDPEKRNKSEEKHRFITNSPSRFESIIVILVAYKNYPSIQKAISFQESTNRRRDPVSRRDKERREREKRRNQNPSNPRLIFSKNERAFPSPLRGNSLFFGSPMFAARRSVAWRRASLRYFRPLDRKLVQREPQYGIPMRAELPPRFHAKGIFHGDDLYLREPGCNLGPHSLFSPELTSSPPWRILFVFFLLLFLHATGSSLPPFRVIRVGKLR